MITLIGRRLGITDKKIQKTISYVSFSIVLCIMALALISNNNLVINSNSNQYNNDVNYDIVPIYETNVGSVISSAPVAPLDINSNYDLAMASSSGSGTSEDPFIIEGLEIDSTSYSVNSIDISNTDAYFILRDCLIYDTPGSYYGIVFTNVEHGKIENNEIYNTYGINIESSSDIEINGNYLHNNRYYTLRISSSTSLISNNYLDSNTYYGMFIFGTGANIIKDNIIVGSHQRGIQLSSNGNLVENNTIDSVTATNFAWGESIAIYSDFNDIIGNFINNTNGNGNTYTGTGIRLNGAYNNYIEGNSISYSTSGGSTYSGTGIMLTASDNNTLTKNIVRDSTGSEANSGYGMNLINSESNLINFTNLINNEKDGVYLDSASHYNTLYLNGFENNNGTGIQAYDGGNFNSWDDGTFGNYWSNYKSITPSAYYLNNIFWSHSYPIAGGSSIDDKALTEYHHGYIPKNPISISLNSEFSSYTDIGDGTVNNPYIIENYVINSSGSAFKSVDIGFTTAHFILRNVKVVNAGTNYAIFLNSLINGRVENCITNNSGTGIGLNSCVGIELSNNEVYNAQFVGFDIINSNLTIIESNIVQQVGWGLGVYYSEFCIIRDNFVLDTIGNGIYVYYSNFTQIRRNYSLNSTGTSFTETGNGFFIVSSNHLELIDNYAIGNTAVDNYGQGNGFYAKYSDDITFTNCISSFNEGNSYENTGNGFYLLYSNSISFENCSAYNNSAGGNAYSGNGFYAYFSNYVELSQCNFYNNQGTLSTTGNGIYARQSHNMIINCTESTNNQITTSNGNGGCGLYQEFSFYAIVVSCNFSNNIGSHSSSGLGIWSDSDSGTFTYNTINGNDGYGISFSGDSNSFYLNYVSENDNIYQVYDTGSSNDWYNPDLRAGNYWGDYKTKYPSSSKLFNAYFDTPYSIYGSIVFDEYPLDTNGLTFSSPIEILNDIELANYATSGSGLVYDPYIIENLYISGALQNTDGIRIQDVTKFFIIRNCTIVNAYNNYDSGIIINNSVNGIIENNIIDNCYFGLNFEKTNESVIDSNYITDCILGISLSESNYNIIQDNDVSSCISKGYSLYDSIHNELKRNLSYLNVGDGSSNSGTGFYFSYAHNTECTDNIASYNTAGSSSQQGSGFFVSYSDDVTFENCISRYNDGGSNLFSGNGFTIFFSDYSTFINCTSNNNYATNSYSGNGYFIYHSSNATLYKCSIYSNEGTGSYQGIGIFAYYSDSLTVNESQSFNNEISTSLGAAGCGIYLAESYYNTIIASNFTNNIGSFSSSGCGILANCYYSIFSDNIITGNDGYGILSGGGENSYYFNLISGNTGINQVLDSGSPDIWNHPILHAGNYWGDYESIYPSAKKLFNAYYETPYSIYGSSETDSYPLIIGGLTISSTIDISNDIELANQAVSGSGKVNDPYIIENLYIDVALQGSNGIKIQDITKAFIIRNCTIIRVSSPYSGIFVTNALSAVIKHNYLDNCYYGIHLNNNDNSTIELNIVTECYIGIRVYQSHSNFIQDNNVSQCTSRGISIYSSNFNEIKRNLSYLHTGDPSLYSGIGFYIFDANYNVLIDNDAYENIGGSNSYSGIGFYVAVSDYVTLKNCNASYNDGNSQQYSGSGFMVRASDYVTYRDCVASYNDGKTQIYSGNGYHSENANFIVFENCSAVNNFAASGGTYSGNGFYLYNSDNVTINICSSYNNHGPNIFQGNGILAMNSESLTVNYTHSYDNQADSTNSYSGIGLLLLLSHYSTIDSNNFSSNYASFGTSGYGIYSNSDYCNFSCNEISENARYGLYCTGDNNQIYLNLITGNGAIYQAYDVGSFNVWKHPVLNAGNYWGDYETYYPSANKVYNCYYDTPYARGVTDPYPLVIGGLTPFYNIDISNDSELENIATGGSGTVYDPYVIESLYIDTDLFGTHGIHIQGVSKPFIIRDCVIFDATGFLFCGIFLDSISYAIIENNIIDNCYNGINITDSININILDNFVYNSELYSLYINSVNNSLISTNILENSNLFGIGAYNSHDNEILNNILNYSVIGIYFEACGNNFVEENIIHEITGISVDDTGAGIILYNSEYIILNDNIVFNIVGSSTWVRTGNGIYLYQSNYITIQQNEVYNCIGVTGSYQGNGILLRNSMNCTLDGNNVHDNIGGNTFGGSGIFILFSESAIVENNHAWNNFGSYSYSGIGFNLYQSHFNTFKNNIAFNNSGTDSQSGNGFTISFSSYANNITGNTAYDNNGKDNWSGCGILISQSDNNFINQNILSNNYGTGTYSGYGIALLDTEYSNIKNNTILGNFGYSYDSGIGIYADACYKNNYSYNYISENSMHGIKISSSAEFELWHNLIFNNQKAGIYITTMADYSLINNTASGNLKGLYYEGLLGVLSENTFIDRPGITILEDHDFRYYSSTGDGTSGDPYIIENFEFDCSGWNRHGIWIENTNAYFNITNCNVNNSDLLSSGIYLKNVLNGLVYYNNASNNYIGITLDSTNDTIIYFNIFNSNSEFGIKLINSSNNDIQYNDLYYNGGLISIDFNSILNIIENNYYFNEAPQWALNSASYNEPDSAILYYFDGLNLTFSMEWTDANGIDTVILEFDGVNYIVTTHIGSNYSITIFDISGGMHQYRWWANNTNSFENESIYQQFTVFPSVPILQLLLNGVDGDITIDAGSTITITIITNIPENLVFISNGTIFLTTNSSSSWTFTLIGDVEIVAFFHGNGNYQTIKISHTITLTDPDYVPPDYTKIYIGIAVGIAVAVLVTTIAIVARRAANKIKERVPPPPPLLKKRPKDGKCAWHGRDLSENTFTCSECGVVYCLECTIEMLKERETCNNCGKPINYFELMRTIFKQTGEFDDNLEKLILIKKDQGVIPPNFYENIREEVMKERISVEKGVQDHSDDKSGDTKKVGPKEYNKNRNLKANENKKSELNYYSKIRESIMQEQQKMQQKAENSNNEK